MSDDHQLGDAPIEEAYREQMTMLARTLDKYLNGDVPKAERKTGFVLLVFPFRDHGGRCNYVSNGADRRDIVTLFREQIARFEGMPAPEGHS